MSRVGLYLPLLSVCEAWRGATGSSSADLVSLEASEENRKPRLPSAPALVQVHWVLGLEPNICLIHMTDEIAFSVHVREAGACFSNMYCSISYTRLYSSSLVTTSVCLPLAGHQGIRRG